MPRPSFEDMLEDLSGSDRAPDRAMPDRTRPDRTGSGPVLPTPSPPSSSGDLMVLAISGETWGLLQKLGAAVNMSPGEVMSAALLEFARVKNIGPAKPEARGRPRLKLR